MLRVDGYVLEPGEKLQVTFHPLGMDYDVPATLICGKNPGKTLLVSAQIHSCEFPSTPAAIRAAKMIDAQKLTGNVIILHCVNTSGFWAHSDAVIPEDGFNLNGSLPGKADGTVGQKLAWWFESEIYPVVDFIIDLHSGGVMETLSPCLFFPDDAEVTEEVLAAANALDTPFLISSHAKSGMYSYAARAYKIPALLVESGYGTRNNEEFSERHLRSICLLLQHRGMYDFGDSDPVCSKYICKDTFYETAQEDGLWYPSAEAGIHVHKGQLLGRTEDFFGNVLTEYRAHEDGIVFYYTHGLSVHEGDPLVAYGLRAAISYADKDGEPLDLDEMCPCMACAK